MSVIPDPLVKGDLDVSSCFDNAGSSNTDLTTGAVIPDTGSPDSHYVRISDELRKELRRTVAGRLQPSGHLLPAGGPVQAMRHADEPVAR